MTSKDRSELTAREVDLVGCRVGFAAYQRKPEFGPAAIIAFSIAMDDVARPFLLERDSTMTRDEERITDELEDVEGILYGVTLGAAGL